MNRRINKVCLIVAGTILMSFLQLSELVAEIQTPCASQPGVSKHFEGPCTGNLQISALDGMARLTYNSVGYGSDNSGFGRRFKTAMNLFLKPNGNNLILTLGDGSIRTFVQRSAGVFTSKDYPFDDRSRIILSQGQ